MATENARPPAQVGRYVISTQLKTVFSILMFLGVAGFVVGLIHDPQRAWLSYLLAFFFFTTLCLGGLFFAALQHATKAGWSVNVRRITEALVAFLPWAALAAAVFLIGAPKIFEWLDKAKVAADPVLSAKHAYLGASSFIFRLVLFFGAWMYFAKIIVGRSIAQDTTGDENITHGLVKWSLAFIIFFGLSYSLFGVDFMMSVEPHWYSTVYGVYLFGGLFQATMAFLILVILYLRKQNLLNGYVKDDHLHDLGKLLFAMTIFWAYIAFSQYMLVWYANIPEETMFIIPRQEGLWLPVSILLLVGKFFVPFIALLPKWAKRNPVHLAAISIWVLAMEYLDLYWLVYPAYYKDAPKFGLYEILIFAGFLGLFLFTIARFLSRNNLVPIRDPRIQESLHHEVIY